MTKLKKVLLICLFSFICLGFTKVSALSTYSIDETILGSYNVYNYVSSNNILFDDVYNACVSKYESDFIGNKYFMCKLYVSSNKLYLQVFSWNTTTKFTKFNPYINGNFISLSIGSDDTTNITYSSYLYDLSTKTFNYSTSGSSNGHERLTFNKKDGNILYSKFGGAIPLDGMFYTNIDYLDNNNFPYTIYSSSYPSINLVSLYDSSVIYGTEYDSVLPFYALNYSLFQDWIGVSNKLVDLGTFENSNVLTYKIKDEDPGNDKDLKIKFTFLNQLDVNANDISIYKYGSQVLTEYLGTTCNNENSDTICEFNLKYNVYDSVDDKLMFDFKFNDTYNVKVEDNSGSNGIYSNYKDVEFEFKEINLKELSGAIFYLRNYDNFEYMKDYLYNVDYNFRFTNFTGNGNFVKPTIYGNDIRYKNTYLYKDNENVFQYNFDNYNSLNNFGMEFIDFLFDSSLLEESKFPCFVIENINYFGDLDTDNLDLYIFYNSSLFNINNLNTSININNGSTNNYISSDGDFNFTSNGSQQTITGGLNSGHIYIFDEEIKVQYKRGLQYFKDKIIDMFEFVSEFYNTMPEKFRVAFSLIFVLLIGIDLFRLLL